MKARVYECLKKLHGRHGPREYGKLCQKLLAIAFRLAGCQHIVERGVQGVDIDVRQASGEKYAIEVKTTEDLYIAFGQKDVDALQKRRQDGYQPLLGVLQLNSLYEWHFAKATTFQPGRLLIERLRPYRLRDLESLLEPYFDQAVLRHFDGALQGSQAYLDRILRETGVIQEE